MSFKNIQEAAEHYARCWIFSNGQHTAGGMESHEFLMEAIPDHRIRGRFLDGYCDLYREHIELLYEEGYRIPAETEWDKTWACFHHPFPDAPSAYTLLRELENILGSSTEKEK